MELASPWPLGATAARATVGARGPLQVHDLHSGEVVARFEVGSSERLLDDPRGGYLVVGAALVEIDAGGQEQRRRPLTGSRLDRNSLVGVTPAHLLVYDEAGVAILDRDDLTPSLQVAGRVAVIATPGLPPEVMVLWVDGGEGVRPWVIAVGPRGRTAR